MKSLYFKVFTFTLLALTQSVCIAKLGNEGGHGGDAYVWDFVNTGRKIHIWLGNNKQFIEAGTFLRVLENAEIESTEEILKLDGVIKDAINYPDANRIIFNRGRWNSLFDERQKWAIVLHEILGLMRLDDSHYQISSPLIEKALPVSGANEKQYPGTVPHCGHLVSVNGERRLNNAANYIGIEFRKEFADPTLYSAYFVVGAVKVFVLQEKEKATLLAKHLVCEYSPDQPGTLSCNNSEGSHLRVLRESLLSTTSSDKLHFNYRIETRSKEIAQILSERRFLLNTFRPEMTSLKQEEWASLNKNFLPVFTNLLGWEVANSYQRFGPLGFDSTITFSFPSGQCDWVYPIEETNK